MATNSSISDDRRFHFEIWSGPNDAFYRQKPSISYVENHNADLDYGLVADDFKLATDELIEAQKREPYLGNFTAPVCYMVRQTIELRLKWVLQILAIKSSRETEQLIFSHNLKRIWSDAKAQLENQKYDFKNDEFLESTERLVSNLHHIDPLGDLFRFGVSRKQAFGRPKTYDRVGYEQELLFKEFEEANQFLDKWAYRVLDDIVQDDGVLD